MIVHPARPIAGKAACYLAAVEYGQQNQAKIVGRSPSSRPPNAER
jgi:hypothetical protein